MAEHREALKTKLRSTVLDPKSRLFEHTKASEQKFAGRARIENLLPQPSGFFRPEGAPQGSITPLRNRAPSSPRLQRERDFGGTSTLSLLRGGELPAAVEEHHSKIEDRIPSFVTKTSSASLASRPSTPDLASTRNRSPARRDTLGTFTKETLNAHTAGLIFPTNNANAVQPHDKSGLWLAKPLSDGSRVLGKKRSYIPQAAARTESPTRPGRRLWVPNDNIVGSSVTVVTEEKPRPHHQLLGRQSYNPPWSECSTSPARIQSQLQFVGLLGFGPTGRKRVPFPDTSSLLDHPEHPSPYPAPQRGVKHVPGKSTASVVVWDLGSYAPEELNEKKFRPSTIRLEGPPPFIPPTLVRRPLSPGRRHYDPGTNGIFTIGDAPSISNPHHPAQLRQGRSPGRYSPLRQPPPSGIFGH